MKLPNADKAIIPREKLRDYLLSQSHPVGRFKAAFFHSLGYSSSEWEVLESDIRSLLENEVVNTTDTEYGRKLEVRGELSGPLGQNANIVTVWIVLKGEQFPRFVTAYPGDN